MKKILECDEAQGTLGLRWSERRWHLSYVKPAARDPA